MKDKDVPMIFDAMHSVQQPGVAEEKPMVEKEALLKH